MQEKSSARENLNALNWQFIGIAAASMAAHIVFFSDRVRLIKSNI
jgi:hypothetical protein